MPGRGEEEFLTLALSLAWPHDKTPPHPEMGNHRYMYLMAGYLSIDNRGETALGRGRDSLASHTQGKKGLVQQVVPAQCKNITGKLNHKQCGAD